MKQPIRPGKFHLLSAFLALTFLCEFASAQPTFFGATTIPTTDGGVQIGPTATIAPPASMAANYLAIIYAEYRGSVVPTMSAAAGQTWYTATTYNPGGTNQAIAVYWCVFNGTWVGSPSVTVGAGNVNGLSAFMTVFKPAVATDKWGVNMVGTNANAASTTETITGVTTTMPNTITMGFLGVGASNTWGSAPAGWTKPWGATAQFRNSTQSHTSIYKIMSTAGATGSPSITQSFASTALKSLVSWAELSNDDCAGAISITPGTTCTNTAGMVAGATLSTGVPLPTCGTPTYDVWYTFTAGTTIQGFTLSSLGTAFTNSGMQVLSGTCGSLITQACAAGTSLTATNLIAGNTYYLRVYSTDPATSLNGNFNLCIINIPSNDDCTGATTITSSTSCVTTPGSLTNSTYTTLTATACGASSGNRNDVWYSFVAQSTNPQIKLTGTPASISAGLYSGTCGSQNLVQCQTSSSTSTTLTVSAANSLTIGQTYYVRVFSNTNATGNFTICVQDVAPPNDACSGATSLTSSTTCNNTSANMYLTTNEAPTITGDCAGTVTYDQWFSFVAQTTSPTITLSSIGTAITNPSMELLSGTCGSQSALFCGTTSISASFLAPGTTYYIRVYSSGTAPASASNAGFNICVTDPIATPPYNDNCATAINLPIWNTCNSVGGNMAGATLSGGVALSGTCSGTVINDIWYKFTAVNTTATITLNNVGANFTGTGIQVFSGTCGALTAIACNSGTSVSASGLTAGTVYYVRVFSTAASIPNGNARFTICATTTNAPVRSGNSYVNISKKTTGGVIQKGDTLEIRFTVNHTSGTMTNLRYVDNVPSKTQMLTTSNDSIRIITNEGLTYKRYTVASGDDAASYKAAPAAGEYNIRMNLGFSSGSAPGTPTVMTNAATSANGQMASTDKPAGGGGLLFAIAYRVVVTGNVGDTVTLFPGQFIYNNGVTDVTLTATPFNIIITDPLNLCSNSIGLNNAVENGGTFGSGTSLNRSTDLTTPIAGYTFVPDVGYNFNGTANVVVGDGRYAIIKNNSPTSSSYANARRQPNCAVGPTIGPLDPLSCTNRMFGGFWYIAGDHSGTSNAAGNAPPDINTASGYMLEVNADYVASEVYRQTINNLCPNTYYEFSAWVKNICPNCGIDSLGKQFANSASVADKPGYPGVLPNLTFTLDNLDYYNTGEIDTVGWIKKGFVFKTDTSTTATFSIRNNAQGGGGNDWALDDIAIATCLPTMVYSPTINPAVCAGNSLIVNDTVSSFFNNYTYYRWQRSTDAGGTWSDITSTTTATLHNTGSTYQFITSDTIPPAHTTMADSADLYRVIVATNSQNLAKVNCLFTDASTIITLKVLNCGPVLAIDLISFSGKLNNGYAELNWVTSKEDEPVTFRIQKSIDGTNFSDIGSMEGHGNPHDDNFYQFGDPALITGKVWYRLALYSGNTLKKYSRIIELNDQSAGFSINNVVNPFNSELDFEVSAPDNSRIDAIITSLSGKPVRKQSFNVYAGTNSLTIFNTENLPAGMYILQIRNKDNVVNKKVIKK